MLNTSETISLALGERLDIRLGLILLLRAISPGIRITSAGRMNIIPFGPLLAPGPNPKDIVSGRDEYITPARMNPAAPRMKLIMSSLLIIFMIIAFLSFCWKWIGIIFHLYVFSIISKTVIFCN